MCCLAYLAHELVKAEGNVSVQEPSIAPAAGIYRAHIDRVTAVQHRTLLTLLDIPFEQYIFITLDSTHHSHFISTRADHHIVLRVARAGLFCTTNYSTKYCSECLELAEDPPAIEVIYLHKYFQIFIYFI